MRDFTVPGIMLREVEPLPQEGLWFDIAGFVGQAERGPLNSPQLLTSWGEYIAVFGQFTGFSYLPYAVYGFFRNGGGRCHVVRVAHESAAKACCILCADRDSSSRIIEVEAIDEGQWANQLEVAIEACTLTGASSSEQQAFRLIVRYQSNGRTLRREVFDRLSMAKDHPRYFARIINGETQVEQDDGRVQYTERIRKGNSVLIRVKDLRTDPSPAGPRPTTAPQRLEGGANGDQKPASLDYRYYTGWDIEARDGAGDYFRPIPANVGPEARKELEARLFGLAALEAVPEVGLVAIPDLPVADLHNVLPAEKIPQAGIVFACPPAHMLKDRLFGNLGKGQIAILQHCAKMGDRFAILDSPLGARLPPDQDVETSDGLAILDSRRNERLAFNQDAQWFKDRIDTWPIGLRGDPRSRDITKFGALYYPWVREQAADFDGRVLLVPPSGHMAGIYSRCDRDGGVGKAPIRMGKAPGNEILQGVVEFEHRLSDPDQEILNPLGVNCLRTFPGRGLRVWGARTLSPEAFWQYVNVRRIYLAIVKTIVCRLQWTVFEPNDRRLWDRITATLTVLFKDLLASGALAGATPEEAFVIKCNQETNPHEVQERGEVIAEIQFAPTRPAEFVVVTIKRTAESLSVSEKASWGI